MDMTTVSVCIVTRLSFLESWMLPRGDRPSLSKGTQLWMIDRWLWGSDSSKTCKTYVEDHFLLAAIQSVSDEDDHCVCRRWWVWICLGWDFFCLQILKEHFINEFQTEPYQQIGHMRNKTAWRKKCCHFYFHKIKNMWKNTSCLQLSPVALVFRWLVLCAKDGGFQSDWGWKLLFKY